ncbi:MAG: RIP metalloprotease RseP [Alphaproteobacteria bacterium]
METLSSIFFHTVPFIIVLSILVFVHELGHYLIAKISGVRIETFSIGFGKEIFGFNDKSGTRWKFSMLPLGGYVRMFGDADETSTGMSSEAKTFTEEEKKVSFPHQSAAKKLAITVAGPLANYLFAIFALTVLIATYGKPTVPAIVGSVIENSASFEAGIKTGDRIVSIDGREIDNFAKLQKIVTNSSDKELSFGIERDGQNLEIKMKPRMTEKADKDTGVITKKPMIGIVSAEMLENNFVVLPLHKAFVSALEYTYDINSHTIYSLWQMVTRQKSAEEIGGPIRIAELSANVATGKKPIPSMIFFIAVLSINLGLINLLPIPILDGGSIVFYFFEGLRGKPLNEKSQEWLFRFGFFVILALMIFATWNDISRLFSRWSS